MRFCSISKLKKKKQFQYVSIVQRVWVHPMHIIKKFPNLLDFLKLFFQIIKLRRIQHEKLAADCNLFSSIF